jgi:hypothetical protein
MGTLGNELCLLQLEVIYDAECTRDVPGRQAIYLPWSITTQMREEWVGTKQRLHESQHMTLWGRPL